MWTSLFVAATFLLFWAYVGYPLFIATLGRWMLPRPLENVEALGRSWILISAYNEEAVIQRKIENSLALESGSDLCVVVVSDGSTDGTDEIVREMAERDPRVVLVRVEGRLGKNHALNQALKQLSPAPDDVIVFSDANATYARDAVTHLRAALESGAWCAVGKLRFLDARTGTARAEGLYWRYENKLKLAEGKLGRLLVANGAIFAMRAGDVPELPLAIGNDFWIPVLLLGSRRGVVYVPGALAEEVAPEHGREEFRRKVRMGNRSMLGVMQAWRQLDTATRFQLLSHKVLRWLGLPIFAVALGSALALAWQDPIFLPAAALLLSGLVVTALGGAARMLGKRLPLADLGVHFLLVHAAALCGVVEALRGKRRLTWEQAHSARRAAA